MCHSEFPYAQKICLVIFASGAPRKNVPVSFRRPHLLSLLAKLYIPICLRRSGPGRKQSEPLLLECFRTTVPSASSCADNLPSSVRRVNLSTAILAISLH